MKEEGKSKKEKERLIPRGCDSILRARIRFGVLLAFSFFLFPFSFSSRAHEPITTKVRFNKEVIRILQRSCLGCHHPGGVAMSLATYAEARPWAKAIKEEVLEKRMPPWHAVKGYGEFRNAPTLTQRDVDLIVNWVEGGAPKGDDADLPPEPLFSRDWQLGNPDLILKPESETTVADDADEYRTVVLPTNLKEDRWLTAIDVLPGNAAVVHCARFHFIKSDGGVETGGMLPVKSGESSSPPVDPQKGIASGTWMPGLKTFALDGGAAQLLPAGARIVMTIHYRGSGEPGKALPAVGLYFAKGAPKKQLQWMAITAPDTLIRVGAEPLQLKSAVTTKNDVELIGIRPRVHPLLISFQATAHRPDGTQQVLIWTRNYTLDWEPTYSFKQPVHLPAGTRVEVIAYFDNSESNQRNPNSPPKPVRWPELTTDPLCALLFTDYAR